jgi:O-antigen/teichoic acid export membrane protein
LSHHLWTASWISILNFIVLRQSELFFLNLFSTPEDMAYFNVGYSLAFASMALVPGVYSTILLPLMAGENRKGSGKVEYQLKISLRYMFQLIIALVLPVCFFAEKIFLFLYGSQYLSAVIPFQIILVCVSLKTLSDCTNAYLLSVDGQSFVLKLIIAASFLTLSLDYFLIKQYQLIGALIALSVSTIFLTFSYMFFTAKHLNLKLEWAIYFRTLMCGAIAMSLIFPFGYYMPNIYGVILGGGSYVIIYFIMLLITLSISPEDIKTLQKSNQEYLRNRLFERLLTIIQKRQMERL